MKPGILGNKYRSLYVEISILMDFYTLITSKCMYMYLCQVDHLEYYLDWSNLHARQYIDVPSESFQYRKPPHTSSIDAQLMCLHMCAIALIFCYTNSISFFAGSDAKQLLKQASSLISQTSLGDVLGSIIEADLDRLYKCYLQDFVRSAHRCYHKDPTLSLKELKVCAQHHSWSE